MKLNPRDLARLISRPDPGLAGVLIFGQDAMRVAIKRQELIAAIIGPQGESEMRLERMQGAELRRDGAQLLDAVKAQGFFPGARVVFVEDASDAATDAFASALTDWRAGDAQIIVTAGGLKATSKLRKLFEGARAAGAAAIYDEPPTREEIETALQNAGLHHVDADAMRDLVVLARVLDPGDFRQTIEKIALYKYGDSTALTPADIAEVAPNSTEAAMDDVLNAVAEGQAAQVGPLLVRLQAQGVAPVTLAIMTLRHFRTLHALCSDPGGPSAGIQRMRPPIFGPRRDRVLGQAGKWGLARLERALGDIIDADLTLRSASNAPSMAVMERTLIRLAMLVRR
ncbi:DNA polymerase III subunit delta [Roseinatronobacter alkalisoli]|uniref:DNA-directed DNA polymerase n=1 Tax=Roseinatronobacter alkalisoli TaxID=3028235 RepID=A0ABT5TBP8_9RHOB|nr:DNA polymerase III subunit delta [Roseinatronobacter sp. HJB301]MDD7972110.1 DNA polymerase III subunit delta [Roseinatronobacter sp. HJB301]